MGNIYHIFSTVLQEISKCVSWPNIWGYISLINEPESQLFNSRLFWYQLYVITEQIRFWTKKRMFVFTVVSSNICVKCHGDDTIKNWDVTGWTQVVDCQMFIHMKECVPHDHFLCCKRFLKWQTLCLHIDAHLHLDVQSCVILCLCRSVEQKAGGVKQAWILPCYYYCLWAPTGEKQKCCIVWCN